MFPNHSYPNFWDTKRLKEIGRIVTGSTPSTNHPEYYGSDYPFISPADLGDNKYITNSMKKISKLGLNISRKIPIKSIMVACIGSTIGKVGLTTELCASNQQINSIIP